MDISRTYSEENLQSLFNRMELRDVLELLFFSVDEIGKGQNTISERLQRIEQAASGIHSKLDAVLEKLSAIENDFADLKAEKRNVEEKLMLMISKLEKLESSIPEEDITEYMDLVKNLYTSWESLDTLTKKFLPLAEYLYSKLQKYDKADYSPVVLELCRAIENELLLKIFSKYTMDLIRRKGQSIDYFLSKDKANKSNKTATFAKQINKAARTQKPTYTLGQMNTILSLLHEDQTVYASPLLQDFDNFLTNNTEVSKLLDSNYIQKINVIVNRYRNPSAHPDIISLKKAEECREMMPEQIDYLMECIR